MRLTIWMALLSLSACGARVTLGELPDAGSDAAEPMPPLAMPLLGPDLEPGPAVATNPGDRIDRLAMVSYQDVHYVVWYASELGVGRIRGARFASDGAALDPIGHVLATGVEPLELHVAVNADGIFGVVWVSEGRVRLARVRASDGSFVTPGGGALVPSAIDVDFLLPGEQRSPVVGANGSNFYVAHLAGTDPRVCVVRGASEVPIPNSCATGDAMRGAPGAILTIGLRTWLLQKHFSVLSATPLSDASRIELGTPVERTISMTSQYYAAASTGDVAWIAWAGAETGASREIVTQAVRLDADLELLDAAPREIVRWPSEAGGWTPSLSYRGETLLVVSSHGGLPATDGSRLARIDALTGDVIDTAPIALAGAPAVSGGSGTSLAVAYRPNEANGLELRVLGEDGIWGAPTTIGARPDAQYAPSVASDGAVYLVSWLDDRPEPGLYTARIGALDGVLLDEPPVRVTAPSSIDAIAITDEVTSAFASGTFLVAWAANGELWAAALDAQGAIVREAFRVAESAAFQRFPQLASDGEGFVLAWQEPNAVRVARIAPDGALRATPISLGEPNVHRVAVASSALGTIVVYGLGGSPAHRLYARALARDGTLGAPQSIGTATNAALEAVALSDRVLVTFSAQDDAGSHVLGQLVSLEDGSALGEPVDLVRRTEVLGPHAVSADALGFLLTWSDARGVVAARFDPAGAPVGGEVEVYDDRSSFYVTDSLGLATSAPGTFLVAASRREMDEPVQRVRARFLVHSGWPGLE